MSRGSDTPAPSAQGTSGARRNGKKNSIPQTAKSIFGKGGLYSVNIHVCHSGHVAASAYFVSQGCVLGAGTYPKGQGQEVTACGSQAAER